MKKIKTKLWLCCLLIVLPAMPALSDEEPDRLFPVFLAGLVRRHNELKNIAMPELEIHTAPGMDNEALYLLTFKTPGDAQIFIAALDKENVSYGTFPDAGLQVALFYQDMMRFIFMDVIGL